MSGKNVLLVLILVTAFFLRFYNLGQNPPSLTWDEAAWGYNAYSLGIDGRDEFGRFLPVDYLESFGDYKPPVYAYLTILPVKLFGLNEFAVRFASAFFGGLTIAVTYFLCRELFRKAKNDYGLKVSLLASLFLALSPWHINLSRAAFEANIASFFIVLGVFLFLKAINGRNWLLIFSGLSFALSLYTFNTARIVSPLLIIIMSAVFFKKLFSMKKEVILAVIIAVILSIPFFRFMITPQAKLRFHEVNIFSDLSIIERTNQEMENDKKLTGLDSTPLWSRIIHNRRFAYFQEYLKHYFDNLSPSFLFIKGDGNPKFSTQDVGQLYIWDLPFLIIGFLVLIREKRGYWWLIPVWLIIGIMPAAAARETPHALRIETVLPVFQIIIAVGVIKIIILINQHKLLSRYNKIAFTAIYFTLFVNFLYYLHGYYNHYPFEYSEQWQYGYKEAIQYVKSHEDKYDQIIVTTELGRPYIYFLFYLKENPKIYRESAFFEREVFGFVKVNQFKKFIFSRSIMQKSSLLGRKLFIDVPRSIPDNAKVLETFKSLNNKPVLVAFEI